MGPMLAAVFLLELETGGGGVEAGRGEGRDDFRRSVSLQRFLCFAVGAAVSGQLCPFRFLSVPNTLHAAPHPSSGGVARPEQPTGQAGVDHG